MRKSAREGSGEKETMGGPRLGKQEEVNLREGGIRRLDHCSLKDEDNRVSVARGMSTWN